MPRGRWQTVCAQPGCTNRVSAGYCAKHAPEAWADSGHRTSSLSGSAQQARARRIIRRDGGVCHVCGQPGADQADHVMPLQWGGADDESNMAAIHSTPCHEAKTQREAAAGRRAKQR